MTDPDLDAMAALLGIPMQAAWREGVRMNLEVSVRLASVVAAFALEDEADMAPVFQA